MNQLIIIRVDNDKEAINSWESKVRPINTECTDSLTIEGAVFYFTLGIPVINAVGHVILLVMEWYSHFVDFHNVILVVVYWINQIFFYYILGVLFLFMILRLIQDKLIIPTTCSSNEVLAGISFDWILNVYVKDFDNSWLDISCKLNAKVFSVSVLNVNTCVIFLAANNIEAKLVGVWILLNI